MTLSSQVVSLPLAKRLKELGVKQESYFYYWYPVGMVMDAKNIPYQDKVVRKWHNVRDQYLSVSHEGECECLPFYAAYTVAEIGEMLPWRIGDSGLEFVKKSSEWEAYYRPWSQWEMGGRNHLIEANTEADARAKLLIYLLEKGMAKP